MWAKGEDDQFQPVPIHSEEKDDKWPEYEGFIYECIGLNRNNSVLRDAKAFSQVEALIQRDQHNLTVPEWFRNNKEVVYTLYEK
ncbi:unnamed protein product, partial [Strongylus vulgaris]